MPIAAIAGISISAILYLSMNIAYFSVLSLDEFKGHDAVAVVNIQHFKINANF